jgi:hypothetical protein
MGASPAHVHALAAQPIGAAIGSMPSGSDLLTRIITSADSASPYRLPRRRSSAVDPSMSQNSSVIVPVDGCPISVNYRLAPGNG